MEEEDDLLLPAWQDADQLAVDAPECFAGVDDVDLCLAFPALVRTDNADIL